MAALAGSTGQARSTDLAIVDGDGAATARAARVAHDEHGDQRAARRLLAERGVERVALERPDGLLVDRLLDAGIAVVADPPQPGRGRTRALPGGAAASPTVSTRYVLRRARAAPTGTGCAVLVARQRRDEGAARACPHPRGSRRRQRVALANQLRAQLDAFWPGAARIFSDARLARSRWRSSSAIQAPPTPAASATKRLTRLPRPPPATAGAAPRATLLDRLRAAPTGRAGELETRSAPRSRARASSPRCTPLVEQISQLTSEIGGALPRPHRRPDLPLPLPRPQEPSSPPPACWPRSATAAPATPPPTRSAADAGQAPVASRIRQTPRRHASAGPATNASATHVGVLADGSRHQHPWAARHLPTRPRPRLRPPPRNPHPRPRLDPRPLAHAGKTDTTYNPTQGDTGRSHAASPPRRVRRHSSAAAGLKHAARCPVSRRRSSGSSFVHLPMR